MSVLQFSAPNLSALLNIANPQNLGQAGSGNSGNMQFSSLLDIVGNPESVVTPTPAQANYQPLAQNVQNNVASAPAPITTESPSAQTPQTQNTPQNSAQTTMQNNNQSTNNTQTTNISNTANSTQPTQPQSVAQSMATPAVTPTQTTQAKTNTTNTTDTTNPKISTAKAATPVDSLSGLLNILAGLIGGLGVTPQVIPAAPTTNTPQNTTTSTADATATGVKSATNSSATLATPVFAKLQQDLSQLQQVLQGAGNTVPPTLSDAQNTQLLQINTALAGDLSAIKNLVATTGQPATQLLQQLASINLVATQTVATTNSPTIAPQPAVQQLLSSDISAIQNLLQKFMTQNTGQNTAQVPIPNTANNIATPTAPQVQTTQQAVVLQNQNQTQAPQTPVITAGIPAPIQSQPTKTTTDTAATTSVSATIASQIEQPQIQPIPQANTQVQNNMTQVVGAVVAAVAGANDNNNSNNSSQNGQNNNSNQTPIMVGAMAANATQATGGADTANFSSILKANGASVTEQVAFQVKTAVGSGDSKISIQLHPNDLGKVDVTLDVGANGKTTVNITADNKQTLDLLQSNSSGLQKALSDAGLSTDASSLSFNLRGGNHGQAGQGQNQQNQYQAANNYSKSQPTEEETITPIATVTRTYTMQLQDGLDIKI